MPEMPDGSRPAPWPLVTAACVTAFLVFAAVYVPRAGLGFIADDFSWALHNRSRSVADLGAVLTRDNGFYRPVVALTFAANEYVSGASPRAYGLTNVALAVLCAWAVFLLARSLALPAGASLLASAVWLLNFHGINMAVLWLSGRTSLLVTLFAALCMVALVRGRLLPAAICLALALFSKEEAVLLPLVGLAWLYLLRAPGPERRREILTWAVMAGLLTLAYLGARTMTGAMTPASAPPYYQPSIDPLGLMRNLAEYADRTFTFSVAVVLLAGLVLRARPRVSAREVRLFAACGAWTAGAFALTVFLPVRSSLYAVLPSVGAAVAAAVLVARMWDPASQGRRRLALVLAVILPLLLAPIHVERSKRWVALAIFSTNVIEDLEAMARGLPAGAGVVLYDDRTVRANLDSAFGTLLNDAILFKTGRHLQAWVEPPPTYAGLAGLDRPCDGCVALELAVRDGRLVARR
jgi:hypothetical protein